VGEGWSSQLSEHLVASRSIGSDQNPRKYRFLLTMKQLILTSSLAKVYCKFLHHNVSIACRSDDDIDADHILDGSG
jgi:hypothetical protein